MYDHREQETATTMPELQALVEENYQKFDSPSILAVFIAIRSKEKNCLQFAATARHLESKFYIDSRRLSERNSMIDVAIQTVMSKSFQARLLYLDHHSTMEGYSGQRKMYDIV